MPFEDRGLSRRGFVKRATGASLTAFSARGIYDLIDSLAGARSTGAYAAGATVRRDQEQYPVDSIQGILDNGGTFAIPPLPNDIFTAKPARGPNWTTKAFQRG